MLDLLWHHEGSVIYDESIWLPLLWSQLLLLLQAQAAGPPWWLKETVRAVSVVETIRNEKAQHVWEKKV